MTAPMAGFGPMAWSPLSGAGGGGTPPVVNTTTTTFEGGPWTFTRDAGAAEDIITFSVADDAASYFRLRNATALATQFAPEIVSLSDNSLPGLSLSVQTNNDVGGQPAVLLTTYVSGTIRPLLQFYNSGGTPLVEVDGLGTWTFVKPAETGVAETIARFSVGDDTTAKVEVLNLSTTDGVFAPAIQGTGATTALPLSLRGLVTSDSGSNPAIAFVAATAALGSLATRPLFGWYNAGTEVMTLKPGGLLDTTGTLRATGRTAPTAGAGVEIDYSGGVGRVLSYNRTGAAYTPLDLEASLFTFYAGGVEKLNVSSTAMTMAVPIGLVSYTVATLPVATATRFIYVSDESGGAVPAFADGTNWRRVTDRAIVS